MSKSVRPKIQVSPEDHEELIALALRALGRAPGAALLLQEMERASIIDAPPANVVAMNSAVAFDYDGRHYRDFHLVYPQCANFTEGRISVLTPVGAALIGLTEGHTMRWPGENGDNHELTVLKVDATRPH